MKSCEGHAWKQVRPVVLKGTRLPRLRALLHESAALCELTGDGRDKVTKQRATRTGSSGCGVHWWVKCLAALVILAMAETVVRSTIEWRNRKPGAPWRAERAPGMIYMR